MRDDDLDRALKLHFGKRAGKPIAKAVREFIDGGCTPGTLRAIAFGHGVAESSVRNSVRRFRAKMLTAVGSNA